MSFELANLAARYDRSMLIPFIGSGMSVPASATWTQMVESLEQHAGLTPSPKEDLIRRSQRALESLRTQRADIAELVYASVGGPGGIPPQTALLASLYWPLVCTTNYDDVYLRAVMAQRNRIMPQVFGRSEISCRRVLQHLSMPVYEALWALQGFLGGRNPEIQQYLPDDFDHAATAGEIVVGHAEYRRVANRTPHFRRSFAEVFRTKSFLFLGSGLTESYFLSLFDEIIELVGPPVQPHFALVPEGRTDPDFMLKHYHIICRTYTVDESAPPAQRHRGMECFLQEFSSFLHGNRTRGCRWGYHLGAPSMLKNSTGAARFEVLRQTLPDRLEENEALAISCGRARNGVDRADPRGVPLASGVGLNAANLGGDQNYIWVPDSCWVVAYPSRKHVYGIVARELIGPGGPDELPSDRRSPDALRQAFYNFLEKMKKLGIRTAYVQLLASGKHRTFHPWVALVQMARAYGEWHRAQLQMSPAGETLVDVKVCVVDPRVIAVLQGNYIDLGEQLQDARLCLTIEVIYEDGGVARHFRIVESTDKLRCLIPHVDGIVAPYPVLYSLPAVRSMRARPDYLVSIDKSVAEFGLVSGSTLVIDFRQQER